MTDGRGVQALPYVGGHVEMGVRVVEILRRKTRRRRLDNFCAVSRFVCCGWYN